MDIIKEIVGYLNDETIYEYTLINANNISLSVISYGGIITKIKMPDRKGLVEEVTVNIDNLDEIIETRPFHGALVGPVAGRISKGQYFEGDKLIQLDQNEGKNTLHSGENALDNRIWKVEMVEKDKEGRLILTTQLEDGLDGFPGNIDVTVCYTLNEADEFTIHYEAETDKKTLFNPTNHLYFNLSGDNKEPIYNHELKLESDHYAVLDDENIPTGELRSVDNTDFDFRDEKSLKILRDATDKQITDRKGFDHPFLLDKNQSETKATLYHEDSGRMVEMSTDADAVVVYTHNHEQEILSKKDTKISMHSGIALETSTLPDAVNQEDFGSIWLDKGIVFKSETIFKFSLQ